jgi:ABC-type uncharacterized transport system substrate-binding protein
MRRRAFLGVLGGAAVAWPLAARAQQPKMPVVGVLNPGLPDANANRLHAFQQGIRSAGFVEGENVSIEYRWAENQFDRLPALAADLVRQRVAVIFARSPPAARAAMQATTNIPIVFSMGEDPVKEGFVPSLNRPGGNVTGFSDFNNQLAGKKLGLMRDAVPKAAVFGLLVNPNQPNAGPDTKDMQVAAEARNRSCVC